MPDLVDPFADLFAGVTLPIFVALLVVFPALVLNQYVNRRFQQSLEYFMQVPGSCGLTGLAVARRLLEHAGVSGVRVVPGTGPRLRNHYHPLTREITLATTIAQGASVSALAIAAHEVGHAVQHARGNRLAWLRVALVPVTNVSFILGLGATAWGLLDGASMMTAAGVALFGICTVFYLVTLAIERDANARAGELAAEAGLLGPEERESMDRVLRAASRTYAARAVQSGCGVLGLALLLGLWSPASGPDTPDGIGDNSLLFTVLLQVFAVVFLFRHRKQATARPSTAQAIELNNAGNLLVQQGDLAEAIELYRQAIRLAPTLASAYTNRGTCYARAGRLDDALADLNTAVRLAPTAADSLLSRAQILTERAEYQATLVDLDRALLLVPENRALVRLHQGNVWLAMGRYDEAVGAFTEAVTFGGHWALARCNRALAHLRRGDLPSALADCDEALRLEPNEPVAYNNRGTVRIRLGDYAGAVADLRTALRLNPEFPNPLKNLAWLQATCPDPAFRDGRAALENVTRAMQKAGRSAREWHDVLAAAYAEAGHFADAVRCQQEFLKNCLPADCAEQEWRLNLYRAGRPFREMTGARDRTGHESQALNTAGT